MLGINARRALKNLHTNKFSWTDKSSLTVYIIICSSSTTARIWTAVQKIQPVYVKNACLSKRMYNYVQQLAGTFLCHRLWKKQHATRKSSIKVKPTTLAQKLNEQPKIWHTVTKVRTNSSTEFGSNPILIDRIRIESAAGSNPILIIQIRTALDRAVDFNERVTAFTTGRAYAPSSDIKGGNADIQLRCEPVHNQYTASFVLPLHDVTATPAESGKNWCCV